MRRQHCLVVSVCIGIGWRGGCRVGVDGHVEAPGLESAIKGALWLARCHTGALMTATQAVVVLIAVIVGAVLKTITGMGFALVVIPVISLVSSVEEAVTVASLANLSLNGGVAWYERAEFRATRDLPTLAGAGVVGAVGGTLLLVSVPDEPVVILLAAVVFGYIVVYFTVPELSIGPRTSARLAPVVGLFGGFLQGSTGISGPLFGTWIHAYRLDRGAHILSVTTLFAVATFAQIIVFIAGGSLSDLWLPALAAVVPAMASIPIGRRFRNRFSSRAFDLAIIATLAASAVTLLLRTFL